MKLYLDKKYYFESNHFHDISLPVIAGATSQRAYDLPPAVFEPVRSETFVGSVAEGGSVNCFSIHFNPHGNGTHTENMGHISPEHHKIAYSVQSYILPALLITVTPVSVGVDKVITLSDLKNQELLLRNKWPELIDLFSCNEDMALIIRSTPNEEIKRISNYSNTNPPYFEASSLEYARMAGYKHIITDLPSVDRETDGGLLSAHHQFWNFPLNIDPSLTITELVYIPDEIHDGIYILNLQIAPLGADASPSRPVLFPINS